MVNARGSLNLTLTIIYECRVVSGFGLRDKSGGELIFVIANRKQAFYFAQLDPTGNLLPNAFNAAGQQQCVMETNSLSPRYFDMRRLINRNILSAL
jgi:hypothetical protein